MKYPLGIQSFESLRNDGYTYVDKTALVYQLVSQGKYYFLSRPRRFGKSLLISTFEAFFKGQKALFDGLAISQLEKEWKEYPVLHIDLNAKDYTAPEAVDEELNKHLEYWEKAYGDEYKDRKPEERFQHVIDKIFEKTDKPVVILVDEYDKPLLQTMDNRELQDAHRRQLKAFYSVVKTMDAKIRFAFFTGVTKFSKVSVFSDLNNLTDITMDQRFATLCGITEHEIRNQFDGEVQLMGEANAMNKDECYTKLKMLYDGYHFCEHSTGVYNPYSLLNALSSRQFRDFWFETGTPTILVEALKHNSYNLGQLTHEEVTADLMGSIDSMDVNPVPLLYQSGYLTVKGYDSEFAVYHLGFPNKEVERGFTRFLIPYYTPVKEQQSPMFVVNYVKDVREGHPRQFMQRLEALFAGGNYQIVGDTELYFQNALYVIFQMMGLYTDVEHHTTDGRIDMLVKTANYIYIIECKIDKSAEEALQQIEDKQYAKPFEHDGRTIFKIGINFSSKTRRMDGWKMAE